MQLNTSNVQAFAQAELNTFNLDELNINRNIALSELSGEIMTDWNDLNSNEVMQARFEHFNIPNSKPSDYSERILELTNGKKVIYGIRHKGGNKELPFIKLCPNFKLENKQNALNIYKCVKHEFKVFSPLYLSYWSHQKTDVNFNGLTYLVGSAKDIKQLSPWIDEKELKFQQALDDSYYEWYKSGYEKFHMKNPELKSKVPVNTLDLMEDSLEQGLLYEIYMGQEKMGLISGERSSFLGHNGIYFNEIYIDEKWKGRGLAKAIQRKFISMNASDDDFIWGTVDDSNVASYKTALSNGRKPIRFECFVNLNMELS